MYANYFDNLRNQYRSYYEYNYFSRACQVGCGQRLGNSFL